MSILDMNLNELNERLEAASLAGGVASKLEMKIKAIKSEGISVSASLHFVTNELSGDTLMAIEKLVLDDLEKQLEVATEVFYNEITGGQK